jgi:hypothetical protein
MLCFGFENAFGARIIRQKRQIGVGLLWESPEFR